MRHLPLAAAAFAASVLSANIAGKAVAAETAAASEDPTSTFEQAIATPAAVPELLAGISQCAEFAKIGLVFDDSKLAKSGWRKIGAVRNERDDSPNPGQEITFIKGHVVLIVQTFNEQPGTQICRLLAVIADSTAGDELFRTAKTKFAAATLTKNSAFVKRNPSAPKSLLDTLLENKDILLKIKIEPESDKTFANIVVSPNI